MKTIYVLINCIMILIYTNISYATPSSYQGNWRWRNDDGDVYSATWKDSMNTPVVITDNKNIRLRIDNLYRLNDSGNISLRYTQWPGVTPWIEINNIDTGKFFISSSKYLVDTMSSFYNQLLPLDSGYSYIKSITLDSTTNYYLTASKGSKYELEYSLKSTSNIKHGPAYFFALFINNSSIGLINGCEYPTLLTSPANWILQFSRITKRLFNVTFIDANNGWVIGDNGTILKTTNGGTEWTKQISGTVNLLYDVSFPDLNNGWIVGNSGTILKTTDGGVKWVAQSSGSTKDLLGVYFVDVNNGWIIGASGTILKTTNGGTNWNLKVSGTSNHLLGLSFPDINNGWAVGNGIILKTTNGGETWASQWDFQPNGSVFRHVYFSDTSNGTAVGTNGTILRTTNGGKVWNFQTNKTTVDLNGVYFIDSLNGVAVGNFGTILKTTNGGMTWILQTSGTSYDLRGIYFPNSNSGTIVGFGGKILKTTTNNVLPVELTSFTAVNTVNGVRLNWSTATELNNHGFEVQRGKDKSNFIAVGFVNGNGTSTAQHTYSFKDKNINTGKYYYRLKQIDFNGSYKYSHIVEVNLNIPIQFSLEQNYPNPFNPTTTIKYSIPNQSLITMKLYDVLGREVTTLVNEEKTAGIYKVELNASSLASGVYFYRIKAGDFVQTKKMILLR